MKYNLRDHFKGEVEAITLMRGEERAALEFVGIINKDTDEERVKSLIKGIETDGKLLLRCYYGWYTASYHDVIIKLPESSTTDYYPVMSANAFNNLFQEVQNEKK